MPYHRVPLVSLGYKIRLLAAITLCGLLSGCYTLPLSSDYKGPPQRPHAVADYYPADEQPTVVAISDDARFGEPGTTVTRHDLQSSQGEITLHLFERPENPKDVVLLVFPVLGGKKNLIEGYFARFFARAGIDTAIVKRNDEFKKAENFDRFEELMRSNVIRDRLALNYLENKLGRKKFGALGMSRGAINVAMTAGADPRLEYNVMIMGGSDVAELFEQTDQPRIRLIARSLAQKRNISEEQLFSDLSKSMKTDPKYLARYLDARKTLLILAHFDHTVPISRGMSLRREIGNPETVMLTSGHYSSLLFTGMAHDVAPLPPLLPPSFIENQSLRFLERAWGMDRSASIGYGVTSILKLPFDLAGRLYHVIRPDSRTRNPISPFEATKSLSAAATTAPSIPR